ncbi:MED22 polymerase, partial [Polypterus senegalus]
MPSLSLSLPFFRPPLASSRDLVQFFHPTLVPFRREAAPLNKHPDVLQVRAGESLMKLVSDLKQFLILNDFPSVNEAINQRNQQLRSLQDECDKKLTTLRDEIATDLYELEEEYYSSSYSQWDGSDLPLCEAFHRQDGPESPEDLRGLVGTSLSGRAGDGSGVISRGSTPGQLNGHGAATAEHP